MVNLPLDALFGKARRHMGTTSAAYERGRQDARAEVRRLRRRGVCAAAIQQHLAHGRSTTAYDRGFLAGLF